MTHPHVIFLTSRPNPSAQDARYPLIGTSAYRQLLSWIYKMDVNISKTEMLLTEDVDVGLAVHFGNSVVILTLDNGAKHWLKTVNEARVVPLRTFALPDPADKNLDKKKLSDILIRCRAFIYR